MQENKKAWHLKLKYALWVDRICTKRSIGTPPYELVYGAEAVFPTSLGVPIMKLIQGLEEEPNAIQRRINQLITLQEKRNEFCDSHHHVQNERPKLKKKASMVSLRIYGRVLLRLLVFMGTTLIYCRKLMEDHMPEGLLMAGS